MILIIDTTSDLNLWLGGSRKFWHRKRKNVLASKTLSEINLFLKEKDIKIDNLTAIGAAAGPGSFTGIRAGISIANALGYSGNLPISAEKVPFDPEKFFVSIERHKIKRYNAVTPFYGFSLKSKQI